MSAKAKSKIKSNESKIAEAVAIASAAEVAPPEVAATPTNGEHASPIAQSPVAEEVKSKVALAVRARIATSKAVAAMFASVRIAQAKAVQKSLAWITAADISLSKSLVAGEQFLLGRLHVSPE